MNEATEIQVTNKWEGDLAVIYSIKNKEDESKIPLLLFFSKSKDPYFTYNQEMTVGEINKSGFYKVTEFESWDDIPDDMAMSLTFRIN